MWGKGKSKNKKSGEQGGQRKGGWKDGGGQAREFYLVNCLFVCLSVSVSLHLLFSPILVDSNIRQFLIEILGVYSFAFGDNNT